MLADVAIARPYDDDYLLNVLAGDVLTLETAVPLVGPAGTANPLDPRIELVDPNGQIVATDGNSAADGRNARLIHAATMPGQYTA